MGARLNRIAAVALVAAALAAVGAGSAGAYSGYCCSDATRPGDIVVSPDGRFAYTADAYNTLAFSVDPDSGALVPLDEYAGGGPDQALSPDGRSLYVGGESDGVSEFARDPGTGLLTSVGSAPWLGGYRGALEMSPDGRELYVTNWYHLLLFDRDPGTSKLTLRTTVTLDGKRPTGLAATADGRFLYVAWSAEEGYDTGIEVLARAHDGSLKDAGSLRIPSGSFCGGGQDLALPPDESYLYEGSGVFERDRETGALSACQRTDGGGGGFAYSPNGRVAFGVDGDTLTVSHLKDGAFVPVRTYNDGEDGMRGLSHTSGVAVSPDGRFLYVTGGGQWWFGGGAKGTFATFRRDPDTDTLTFVAMRGWHFDGRPTGAAPPSVEIDGGAEYTNDPHVTLTIDVPREGPGVQVSNDGGFDPSEHFPWSYRLETDWTLDSTGPDRLPKTVYVRAYQPYTSSSHPGVYSGSIVLDQSQPQIVAVERAAHSLRVRARDRVSGVSALQVAKDRRHPGHWRHFAGGASYHVGNGRLYVRVRDRARNRSHWRQVAG